MPLTAEGTRALRRLHSLIDKGEADGWQALWLAISIYHRHRKERPLKQLDIFGGEVDNQAKERRRLALTRLTAWQREVYRDVCREGVTPSDPETRIACQVLEQGGLVWKRRLGDGVVIYVPVPG